MVQTSMTKWLCCQTEVALTLHPSHCRPTDELSRRPWNLLFSLLLLVSCYITLLCPVYLQQPKEFWASYNVPEKHIKLLHNYSVTALSGSCKPQYIKERVTALYPGKLQTNASIFIQKDAVCIPGMWQYKAPFGMKGLKEHLQMTLKLLPETELPASLQRLPCKRCIVMGSGGQLRGSRLGKFIDMHDVVFRLNSAPVHGYEEDVGQKTTIRLTYPEGAPWSQQEYDPKSLFTVVIYKTTDFTWIRSLIERKPISWWDKLWFWQEVPEFSTLKAHNYRILNPDIIRKTLVDFLGHPEPQNKLFNVNQIVPTVGVSAVVMALHICDEVNLAGFGYDMSHPDMPLHYYGTCRMGFMNSQTVHNIDREKLFLMKLVTSGAIKDLTGGLHW
ncbi:lactosylceramide alpha-2,3-sialyltransferase-like isoform X2 [Protopterus annectens]|uniref:lactosylceramide alpha-2,3-sialyltransferase-like isoform X2 n=1 Tax=Protopterus annectens TaxID=7888 RepID=UPI001CFC1BB9|nr:lactosylceramide alpha-2,3-sialyltransferase-like isoform X2 [Protopterus annectens]